MTIEDIKKVNDPDTDIVQNIMLYREESKRTYRINYGGLELGKVYKNWGEVCKALGIPECGGNQKVRYVEMLKANTEFEKKGHTYKFTSVFNSVGEDDEAFISRVDCMELLMASLFASDHNPIILTNRGWYQVLGAVNENWKPYDSGAKKELSKLVGDTFKLNENSCDENINYFYNTSSSKITQSFTRALKNLARRGCVDPILIYTGMRASDESRAEVINTIKSVRNCGGIFEGEEKDDNDDRKRFERIDFSNYRASSTMAELTVDEMKAYLLCKQLMMEKYGIQNMNDLVRFPEALTDRFYNDLNMLTMSAFGVYNISKSIMLYPQPWSCRGMLNTAAENDAVRKLLNNQLRTDMLDSARSKQERARNNKQIVGGINYETGEYEEAELSTIYMNDSFLPVQKLLIETLLRTDTERNGINNILENGIRRAKLFARQVSINQMYKNNNIEYDVDTYEFLKSAPVIDDLGVGEILQMLHQEILRNIADKADAKLKESKV